VLVASRVAGAASGPSTLGFGALAAATLFVIVNDPRKRFRNSGGGTALPMPSDVRLVSRLQLLQTAVVPSTVGVTALAVIAVALGKSTLAACLGGVLAGLGLASLAASLRLLRRERRDGCEYYAERDGSRVFERRR
jgi:hypothetical protein